MLRIKVEYIKPKPHYTEGHCSYCGKSLRSKFWISLVDSQSQCSRLLCRMRTGHLWWGFKAGLQRRRGVTIVR